MFSKVNFFDGKDFQSWKVFLNDLCKDEPTGVLLLVAEETPFDFNQLQPLFKEIKTEVCGCIFPEVIYNGLRYKQGVIGCSFNAPVTVEVIKDLSKFDGKFSKNIISKNTESLLIFNDGWANNISLLIETLYEMCENEINFVGAGTGSIADKNRKSLFTCNDYFTGGAIIAAVDAFMSIGVEHGLQPVYEPFIATNIDKRILKTINWEPALEFYKKVVEKDSHKKMTKENFRELADSYIFGMLKYDNEIIPRCTIDIVDEESILLGSETPENSIMTIMKADIDKFIEAAGFAIKKAKTSFENKKKKSPAKALIIECITRTMFLSNRFDEQIKLISNKAGKDVLLFGVLSLGEIASTGDKFIELYNKTLVIGMSD